LPKTDKVVGIDLGLKDFLITSNGEVVSNPRTLSKYEDKIARLNKRLATKERFVRLTVKRLGSMNKEFAWACPAERQDS